MCFFLVVFILIMVRRFTQEGRVFLFFFNHFTAEAQRRRELHCNRENCNRENRELLFFSFFLLKVVCGSFGGGVVLCASVSLW